ncbi:hypothetical protein AXG93_2931s1070 [Marchantia polymorpha subsp. ruderalis]|uniref:DUF427 domain-containing protein n=1 Tax=Marchantia polymorpha subsp. ruderalis TaxID=1480154 RepID=A0A176VXI3_MARPO|nr:hypothetical protein AXG93_2931s1070 [Marchantia polymorpha subsp. ruderalis]
MAGVYMGQAAQVRFSCSAFATVSSRNRAHQFADTFVIHTSHLCGRSGDRNPNSYTESLRIRRTQRVDFSRWSYKGEAWDRFSLSKHSRGLRASTTVMAAVTREPVGPGQESVWDYPRPPALEKVAEKIKILFNGEKIAETTNAYRVLETSHPPGVAWKRRHAALCFQTTIPLVMSAGGPQETLSQTALSLSRLSRNDSVTLVSNDPILWPQHRALISTTGVFVYYIPATDVTMEHLSKAAGSSHCEWKGDATWWTLTVGAKTAENVAWSYETPTEAFLPVKGYLAFYAGPMDACYVGEEQAQPQPGNFYGGWVTSKIVGPFKGGPGSWGW